MRSLSKVLLALLVAGSVATAAVAAPVNAELVVRHARIYTADAAHSTAQALAVRDGKIVFVGSDADSAAYVGPHTTIRNAGGRRILPGLVDAHLHPAGIVDLDVCDLNSKPHSLRQITEFVRACIVRYRVPAGQWVNVQLWNYTDGNQPDATHPTLRAALDLASTTHPVQLMGNDGHHGAFNSLALARAKNSSGRVVGFSKATLASDFVAMSKLIGVDAGGEPNGTANEEASTALGGPDMIAVDFDEVMRDPGRVTRRLNSVGITTILDADVAPSRVAMYDSLYASGELTIRASLAQFYDPDAQRAENGQPDWERMLASAREIRAKYASHPLLRAGMVKLYADGVLEGNPYAVPPTLPESAALRPYLQPIFALQGNGRMAVTGYVDTGSALCGQVRAHPADYDGAAAAGVFLKEHGYHPAQCAVSVGQLQHDPAVILEFARRFHLAGFELHIHAISDAAVRVAVDAIEGARAADGISSQHDALAHLQLVHPDDVVRIGRDRLYLAMTYSWIYTDVAYDMNVVPFYDRVTGGSQAALHPADGYYERNAYPVKSLRDAGGILVAGSDAPVDTRDPRPFVNMAAAVTRSSKHSPPLNRAEQIPFQDVLDAYTIRGAEYLHWDGDTGSIEVGKSADFVLLDRDVVALAATGKAADIAATKVLGTWFMGRQVYGSSKKH